MSYWRPQLFYHPDTAASRPLVACSACLLGEPVRYDGGHREQASIGDHLAPWLQLQAICPEVGIGLGVPRPTLKVVDSEFGQRVVHVDNPHHDVSAELLDYADSYMRKLGRFWPLTAYIFKARSPSCGVGSTLINPATTQQHSGDGLFAGRVRVWADWLPLYEEDDLQTETACELLLLHSFICRDLLWQGQQFDGAAALQHYSERLGSMPAKGVSREQLWASVRCALTALDAEQRGALIETWRAA